MRAFTVGKPSRRRARWRIAAAGGVVLALAAAGCSSGGSSGGSGNGKVTITELDYFTSSGGNTALNWYNQKFEKEHPGVTVKRTAVAFADLITKVLQDASAGDMPNLMMLDNPNVAQVAATGQLRAMNDLPGFTTSGYYPGAISECTYQGKQYCYPIGTNSVGLFYNKAMLKAAGLQPPATWDELAADAKKLTKPPVYGMAFDATADEQSTWQLEPFFWSNGASLSKVDTPAFQQALQLWVNMVKDGSASKSVLNWGQAPDLTQQFTQGHAAMMVNGPWIFPDLNAKGWKYNDQYGIVPIPTDKAGQTVVAPLGGETIDLGTGGSTEQQKLAWAWVQGMQAASTMEHVTSSVSSALQTAQGTVSGVQQVSGG